ncbi:MAG TPA: response regulator transcription factor, partial [Chitinophagaceae bacterium]
MKLLIIEDERALSDSICSYLNNESFMCECAYDFESAMEKISLYDYTCIILDITLPGGSGLQLLQELKANNKQDGVLIISAKNSLEDKVYGLKTGADDYLTKPFHLSELGARVAAIIRRKSFNGSDSIQFDELSLDLQGKTARVHDKTIELTRKEYELLLYFISNKNKVVSKGAIAEHLWGDDMDVTDNYDFLYTHIKNLR